MSKATLGVNIDHIATLRQLRGTPYPDLVEAAAICERAGAKQITIHLREDRRHIQDADVYAIRKSIKVPLNLEISLAPKMLAIARKVQPDWVCLVPEKRQEVTTEGGLDIRKQHARVASAIKAFKKAGVKVSLFVEPDAKLMKLCSELGAEAVELHTGKFCHLGHEQALKGAKPALEKARRKELERIQNAGLAAQALGLRVNAGHGLDYENVKEVVAIHDLRGEPLFEEYNIGHVIICRAAIVGLDKAVREMVSAIGA